MDLPTVGQVAVDEPEAYAPAGADDENAICRAQRSVRMPVSWV